MNHEEEIIFMLVRILGGSVDITPKDYLDIDPRSVLEVSHLYDGSMHLEIKDPVMVIDAPLGMHDALLR